MPSTTRIKSSLPRSPRPSAPPSAKSSACRPARRVTGKLTAALRRAGFDLVFDTDVAADLTIMEEGSELVQRLTSDGRAADDHLLLAGVGEIYRALLPGAARSSLYREIAAHDAGHAAENLLCGESTTSTRADRGGLHYAVYREEI